MTKRHFRTTALLLAASAVFILATGFRQNGGSMALVFKIVQDVTKKSSTLDWTKAVKGENLSSGDQVKTGTRSLAIVKFLDNSILRVREQSVLTVSAEGYRGAQVKTIQLNSGAFGFDVKKQRQNEQFRLTSPTSVASIRGTQGKWSGGAGKDTLVVGEGLVNLKNTLTNKDLDVPAGSIGFSGDDGSLSARRATPEELAEANLAATGGSQNQLNLELKDAKGNRKELKLKYHR
jgi:hypothetical protein